MLISFGFLLISKSALVNNGGFVGLGAGNAGETRVFGHDPRNLRGKNLRGRGFGWFTICLGLGFLARDNYKHCFCKIKNYHISGRFLKLTLTLLSQSFKPSYTASGPRKGAGGLQLQILAPPELIL